MNHHKVHFSRWINHNCLHKISRWTLDFFSRHQQHFLCEVWSQVGKDGQIADVLMDWQMCLTLQELWEWTLEQSWGELGIRLSKRSACWAESSPSARNSCQPADDVQVYFPSHNNQKQKPFVTQDFPWRGPVIAGVQSFTSALSWKTGDCMSRGLPTPMQLPSESDVSSSCRDSAEFTLSDFTKDGEITGKGGKKSVSNIIARCLFLKQLYAWQERGENDCDA